jgi:hypothetical protein
MARGDKIEILREWKIGSLELTEAFCSRTNPSAELCVLCASAFRKVHDVGPLLRIERSVYNTISTTLCADLFYRRGAEFAELRRGAGL